MPLGPTGSPAKARAPRRRGLLRALALALALASGASAGPASAAPAPPGEPHALAPYSGTEYGINIQSLVNTALAGDTATVDRLLDRMREMRLQTARLSLLWPWTEPQRGRHAPAVLDRLVAGLAKRRIRAELIIDSAPAWVVPPNCVHGVIGYAMPTDLGAYRAYLRWAIDRYGPGGSFWKANPGLDASLAPRWLEVWNEPNDPSRWCGRVDAGQYARMLRATLDAVQERTPTVRVALGGPTNHWGANETSPTSAVAIQYFLRDVAAADPRLLERVDGFSLHPYGWHGVQGSGEAVLTDVTAYRELLMGMGIAPWVPILATETGVTTPPGYIDGVYRDHASQEPQRSAMIRRGAELGTRNDCAVAAWQPHTLVTSGTVPNRSLTMSEDAYQRLVREQFFGFLGSSGSGYALEPTALAFRDFIVAANGVPRQPHCLARLRQTGVLGPLRSAHPDWFAADGSLVTSPPAVAIARSAEVEAQAVARIRGARLRLTARGRVVVGVRCLGRCRVTIRDARRKRLATRVGTCGRLSCRVTVRLGARASARVRRARTAKVAVRVAAGPWVRAQLRVAR